MSATVKKATPNVLLLPAKFYVSRNLPAQVMATAMSLVTQSGEFELNPSLVDAVNLEAASGLANLPEDFRKVVLTEIYLKANEIVAQISAPNELTRLAAIAVVIAKMGENRRDMHESRAYLTAVGMLDEINSADGADWSSVKELRAASQAATFAFQKVAMSL
jgi:hypothetical protein